MTGHQRHPHLDPLFAPASIALVGMSANPDSFAGRLHANLRRTFAGELLLVNPAYDELAGEPCHRSIEALPAVPDLALVLTGAEAAVDIVARCAELGVGAATIYAAGFGEASGDGTQRALALGASVGPGRLRLAGPNTIGFANYLGGGVMLASANVPPGLEPGPLAIVSQSGGVGLALLNKAYSRGLPVGLLAVTGNAVDLGTPDYVRYYANLDTIDTIAIYVEASPDARDLVDACLDATEAGKTVLLYRAGRTREGALMAASHTGVLTQDSAVFDAALESVGVITHRSLEDLFESTYAAMRCGRLNSGSIAIFSSSGGVNVQAADLAVEHGLELADLSAETVGFLTATYPFAAPGNPYDPTGLWRRDPEQLWRCVAAIANDPAVSAVVQVMPAQHASYAWAHVDVAEKARNATDTPMVSACVSAGPLTRPVEDALRDRGVPVFESMDACFKALSRLAVDGAGNWRRPSGAPEMLPPDRQHSLSAAIDGRFGAMDEVASKTLLRAYGIPTVPEMIADSASAAVAAAAAVGFPVAMKALIPGLMHKTEAGAVILGLADEQAVLHAYGQLSGSADNDVVVQPMVSGSVELIVGGRRDEQLGPIVVVGIGGVFAELAADVTCRLAPVRSADAAQMVNSLRAVRLLDGFRGSHPVDRGPIIDVLVRLSWLLFENPQVVEVDLNPVIVTERGPVAVDALVVVEVPAAVNSS